MSGGLRVTQIVRLGGASAAGTPPWCWLFVAGAVVLAGSRLLDLIVTVVAVIAGVIAVAVAGWVAWRLTHRAPADALTITIRRTTAKDALVPCPSCRPMIRLATHVMEVGGHPIAWTCFEHATDPRFNPLRKGIRS